MPNKQIFAKKNVKKSYQKARCVIGLGVPIVAKQQQYITLKNSLKKLTCKACTPELCGQCVPPVGHIAATDQEMEPAS
jgi:hypothetical protein